MVISSYIKASEFTVGTSLLKGYNFKTVVIFSESLSSSLSSMVNFKYSSDFNNFHSPLT